MMKNADWYFISHGSPQCTPIIFLHGFMGTSSDWLPVVSQLDMNMYAILPDLPGHGKTRLNQTHDSTSLKTMAAELAALLKNNNLAQPIFAGYSMGGRIALSAALQFPGICSGLVLESVNPGITNPEERAARRLLDRQRAESLLKDGIDDFVESWYDMDMFTSLRRFPKTLRKIKKERKKQNPSDMACILESLSPGKQPDYMKELPQLKIPVLLIAGSLDSAYVAINRKLSMQISNVSAAVVEKAGHNSHVENPEHFSKILVSFLHTQNLLSR